MTDREQAESRPGVEMVVERGKIREFASATKSSNPAYLDDQNPVIPPTFLVTASFWTPRRRPGDVAAQARAAAAAGGAPGTAAAGGSAPGAAPEGRNMARVLDGGREFIFHGPPPRAGARLTTSSRLADRYEKEGRRGGTMTFTVTVTEYRDETGKLVAESRGTGIVTSRAPTQEA